MVVEMENPGFMECKTIGPCTRLMNYFFNEHNLYANRKVRIYRIRESTNKTNQQVVTMLTVLSERCCQLSFDNNFNAMTRISFCFKAYKKQHCGKVNIKLNLEQNNYIEILISSSVLKYLLEGKIGGPKIQREK